MDISPAVMIAPTFKSIWILLQIASAEITFIIQIRLSSHLKSHPGRSGFYERHYPSLGVSLDFTLSQNMVTLGRKVGTLGNLTELGQRLCIFHEILKQKFEKHGAQVKIT
ncbi:hypothetical protein [Thalassobacillus cyri]|uniref:hypothetical protein n=1 Tax=Thalassobacillus cyri TaxID=571932 RepID=UPI000B82B8F5|nr:hypothetical protein [Thalassobacillus cyri]